MPIFDKLKTLKKKYRIKVFSLDEHRRKKLRLRFRSPIIVEESSMSILPEKEETRTFTIEPISEISKYEDVTTFDTVYPDFETASDEVAPEDIIIDLPYEYSEDEGVIASEDTDVENEDVKTF